MIFRILALCVFGLTSLHVATEAGITQQLSPLSIEWHRRYKPGEVLKYEMKGKNQGWTYQLLATDTTKEDATGSLFEEIAWSDMRSNAPMTLSPISLSFRQNLSLDGTGKYVTVPDLSKIQPFLIGPITDTLTFYSDLLLARRNDLNQIGQHAYVAYGKPSSWANGHTVLLGQDSIDFDLMLAEADPERHTATFLVRHVPPKQPQIQLSANWMKVPVSDTPNNWVQITRSGETYIAQVGKETFDVRITVDTQDGKVLTVRLDNPVLTVTRECEDAAVEKCGPPKSGEIHREVSFRLLP